MSGGIGGGGGEGFDLDTKGQIHGYDTAQAAIDVTGNNDYVLVEDSTVAAGIAWKENLHSSVTPSSTTTFTNKSIDSDTNTITNIVNADIKAAAAIDQSKIAGTIGDMLLAANQAITQPKNFVDDIRCYWGTSSPMSIWLAGGGSGYIRNTAGTIQFQSDVGAFGAACFAYSEANNTLDSSGHITGYRNCHRVSTYLSAATDNCIVADYTAAGKAGSLFVLIAYNNNDVTLVDSGGTTPEFLMNGDFTLDNIADTCTFVQFPNLTNNYELSRSNNA